MRKWEIPAGSLAISKDGRLVHARAFGYADLAKQHPLTVEHRFRIASSSKPVTAVAILRLVQARKLRLDEPAFALLPELPPARRAQLKTRACAPSPSAICSSTAAALTARRSIPNSTSCASQPTRSAARPASHTDIIRYVRGRPLAFTPGTKYIYSNFGYNVLGRIIEQKSRLSYSDYIKRMLQPVHMQKWSSARPNRKIACRMKSSIGTIR